MTRSDKKKNLQRKESKFALKYLNHILLSLCWCYISRHQQDGTVYAAIKRAKKFKHFTTSLWSQGILQLYTTTRQQGFS